MHVICNRIIDIAWVVFLLVWLAASFSAKPDARKQTSSSRLIQMLLVTAAFLLLFDGDFSSGLLGRRFVPNTAVWWVLGTLLVALGILVSFWARLFLGSNWSATVTVKENHELVRSGLYAIVRNPIYSGLLLALLGTAINQGEWRGLLAVCLALWAWKWKSLLEEAFMREQFGGSYVVYRQQVKALIPFVW